jgi:AcrR family transcriptional regulator
VAASTTGAAGPSRRDRQRQQTLRDLKQATLAEIREHGAVAVSLRSVARRMAMSPAGLYRYVGSREELLTLLIAEGYQDLGHHLEVAPRRCPRRRSGPWPRCPRAAPGRGRGR